MSNSQPVGRGSRRAIVALAAAVAVLGINDHVLKGADVVPGWLTGKLSDFAGVLVASVLLARLLRGMRLEVRAAVWLACASIGGAFAALKLSPAVAAAYDAAISRAGSALGLPIVARTQVDATDLMALAVLPVAAAVAHGVAQMRGLASRALIAAASLLCMGTSASLQKVDPHWGFAAPIDDRAVIPFRGGLLDIRFGRASAEGSFELAIGAHADSEPLVIELARIRAQLHRELVAARVDPPTAGILRVPAHTAAAARIYFRARGFDTSSDGVRTAAGHLTIPARVGERHHVFRLELALKVRHLYWPETRFGAAEQPDGTPDDPWMDER